MNTSYVNELQNLLMKIYGSSYSIEYTIHEVDEMYDIYLDYMDPPKNTMYRCDVKFFYKDQHVMIKNPGLYFNKKFARQNTAFASLLRIKEMDMSLLDPIKDLKNTYVLIDLDNVHDCEEIIKDNGICTHNNVDSLTLFDYVYNICETNTIKIIGVIGKNNSMIGSKKFENLKRMMDVKIADSSRKDAADTFLIMTTSLIINERRNKETNIIIITKDHFGETLCELWGTCHLENLRIQCFMTCKNYRNYLLKDI